MVHADGTVLMQAAMFLQQSAPIVPVTCMSGWKAAVMVDAVARKVVAAVLLADVGECHSFDKTHATPMRHRAALAVLLSSYAAFATCCSCAAAAPAPAAFLTQ